VWTHALITSKVVNGKRKKVSIFNRRRELTPKTSYLKRSPASRIVSGVYPTAIPWASHLPD